MSERVCSATAFINVALPPPTGQCTVAAATNPDGRGTSLALKHTASQHNYTDAIHIQIYVKFIPKMAK